MELIGSASINACCILNGLAPICGPQAPLTDTGFKMPDLITQSLGRGIRLPLVRPVR